MILLHLLAACLVEANVQETQYRVNTVETQGLEIHGADGVNSAIGAVRGAPTGDFGRYSTFQTNLDIIQSMVDYLVRYDEVMH